MSRYGCDHDVELNCPNKGCDGTIELEASIGYPDPSVGYSSCWVDDIEPDIARCPECGKDFDSEQFVDAIIKDFVQSQEPEYEHD